MLKTEELKLVSEWDKTFPQSEKVDHKKVTFVNRYGSRKMCQGNILRLP